jgi:hypothetical protein
MARVEGPDGLANTFGMIGSGLGPRGLRGPPRGEPHATQDGGMGQRMVIGYDHVQLRDSFIHVDLSSSFIGRVTHVVYYTAINSIPLCKCCLVRFACSPTSTDWIYTKNKIKINATLYCFSKSTL